MDKREIINILTGIIGTTYLWWFTAQMDIARIEIFWLCFGAMVIQVLYMKFENIYKLLMNIINKNYKDK